MLQEFDKLKSDRNKVNLAPRFLKLFNNFFIKKTVVKDNVKQKPTYDHLRNRKTDSRKTSDSGSAKGEDSKLETALAPRLIRFFPKW